ncbi:MFS transporter [Leekyejoonella antrihumi]|uniref:MFS transporter n=2 Tax=Leekyejoonella antrihumi TaxID=1660198 RepID=A0A563EB86_9MICO|nr:MFS transporter [Leekyejoonella antrihumi]TWP39044.1 MFS transporter [Leekyejoonella antrihumi]
MFADTTPLRVPAFRRLWTANIITVIGAQLTVVAVPAQIYAITRSSAYVGLTGAFGLVPLIFFGLYGGALADVMDRRRLMMISTVALIATSATFFAQALLGLENVWLLLTIFAVQQAFFAINQPTRSAILPRIIPMRQLPAANSLNMTVLQFGAIAGPMVGGALIPVLGFAALYLVDTISLFATLWAVISLPGLPPEGPVHKAGFRSVMDGFAYLRHHKVLLMSFLVDIIAMVFGMPRALFPQIAHQSFGGPVDGGLAFALLFAGIPAGAVVGGVFSGWVSRTSRQGYAVICAIVVWGLAMAGFGVAVGMAHGSMGVMLVFALLALVIGGAADMASAAFRSTMLQEAAGDEVRGRLQGVFTVVVSGGPRLADVLHGTVGGLVGTSVAATGGGVLVVVLVIGAAITAPAFIRYRVQR